MKIEIWSDVLCPFCYIGKRNFEKALKQFAHKDKMEVVWRSFQLDPSIQNTSGLSVHDYLAERKGMSRQQAKQMNDRVTDRAKIAGLQFNLDQAVIANTLDAHRLTHLAAGYGLQSEAEERLFAAYFTEGKNIGDPDTLVQLGSDIGLDADEVRKMLLSDAFRQDVRKDLIRAQQAGINGVPFFVLNGKYAVSGAQPAEVFTQVLLQVWEEEHPAIQQNTKDEFCTRKSVCS